LALVAGASDGGRLSALCILAAGKTTVLAASLFTLSWTHSIEKTRWEEDWRVGPDGLQIVEARVKGSGAGMEPPEGAALKDGWWSYAPQVAPRKQLVLASSGATASDWRICASDRCVDVGGQAGEPITMSPCGTTP
jgi:hypothetical protein